MNLNSKQIIGLIAFIVGILLITSSTMIPLPIIIVNVIGALLIAYGVLALLIELKRVIENSDMDNEEMIGLIGIIGTKGIIALIAFIVGIMLITYSAMIPLPVIIINVVGALLIAYGVLNFINIIKI
ncbi:MAG: hypothetical protein FWE58_03540 [Methanobrevibacter sp.]|nr:hypothetical protein [Methanobrevibacter sp.]